MKKIIGTLVFTSLLFSLQIPVSAKATAIKYQNTIDSVVEIEMMDQKGQFYYGTGSIISVDGVILTAAHVIVDPITQTPSQYINICPIKNEYSLPVCKYSARVLVHDSDLDLALLYIGYELDENYDEIDGKYIGLDKASELNLPYVDFSDEPPLLGDGISILGFPADIGSITFTQGKISSFIPITDGIIGAYVTDAIINPGNSGGPAYNEDEKIVGIVSAVTTGQIGGNYGLIISGDQILLWFLKLVSQDILSNDFVNEIFSNDVVNEISKAEIFSDVDINNKNAEAINFLKKENIINGYEDGSFKPDNTLNRAELLKILVTSLGFDPDENNYKDCFPDVTNQWYAKYICLAKDMGWVGGYSDGKFKPANSINKAESMKMLLEIYGIEKEDPTEDPFTDVKISAWFSSYINTAKKEGILEENDTTYEPGKFITRAQISENIYRLMGIKEREEFLGAVEGSICKMLTAYKKNKKIPLSELDQITIDIYSESHLDVYDDTLLTVLESKYYTEVAAAREKAYLECGETKLNEEFLNYLFSESP